MTNNEKNVIMVLKALSDNSFKLSTDLVKDNKITEAGGYLKESLAYDLAIDLLLQKKDLHATAKVFKVRLVN